MEWVGQDARVGDRRGAYIALVGKSEEKRPYRRPSHRWEDHQMDLQEAGWGGEGIDWVDWLRIGTGGGHL
jgi:hypothetical protein